MKGIRKTITNFGGNVRFEPRATFGPKDERELLDILGHHSASTFRAMGALHSWSPCMAGTDVALDLGGLDRVAIHEDDDGRRQVTVGAGCRIRRLLRELRREGLTLPAVGLIDSQTIAGAIATGTHGSGKASLSHYVTAVRAAALDPGSGRPTVHEWSGGEALRAARCGLGCTGIVLSVTFPCVAIFNVEEYTARHDCLDDVLALTGDYPQQQAYLIPWLWRWFAHHRRDVDRGTSWWALPYRMYRRLTIDYGFHLLVTFLARTVRSARAIRAFYRRVFPALILTGTRVTDRMDRILLMRHETFRHVETELFVPESRVREAADFVQAFLVLAAGDSASLGDRFDALVRKARLEDEIGSARGVYVHHFPITFRRVLPDDTMISMASDGDGSWWAISLITFRVRDLAGFETAMASLTRLMAALFGARPHWGKHCPLDTATLARLYPELPAFRRFCEEIDPAGNFRNSFAVDKLGFGEPEADS